MKCPRVAFGWSVRSLVEVEWLLALVGIASVYFESRRSKGGKVVVYLLMGWLFLIALGPLSSNIPPTLFPWLIAGGVFYSVGAVIFLIDWPPLWHGCFSAHHFWHVFVLSGSACYFVLINACMQLYTH